MDSENTVVDIWGYLDVIKRRKDVIILFFITVVGVVSFLSFYLPPVYRSTVTLLIDPPPQEIVSVKDYFALSPSSYSVYDQYYRTQLEIIKSRQILEEVFKKLRLSKIKMFQNAPDPIKLFAKYLKVEPIRDTRLIKISYFSTSPRFSQVVAETIATTYIQKNLEYIINRENIRLLKNEYVKLQSKYDDYSKIYKEKHPKMIRLKQQLEELAQKIKNADASSLIPSNAKINNVRIVEHAVLPSQPVRPKKFLNIVLSIFVGLVGGVMLAFFFEYTDNTFRVAQDIEKELNVKFLGYVPRNGFKTPTSLWIRNFNLTDPFLVKKFPQSLVSNSLRLIKRRLKDAIDSTNSRIIMFSPIEPYKTFYSTITNLSAVFSEESKVLIIDTDIRSQKFRNILKMNPQATLQKYLEGKCSLSEIVYTFQDIPNLSIIFSKDKDSSQLESIDISKIRELLYKVSSRFDYIFICSAPLGIFEEGYALAEIVDKIVFVIEYASTKKSIISRIDDFLDRNRSKIIGAIMVGIYFNPKGPLFEAYKRYKLK